MRVLADAVFDVTDPSTGRSIGCAPASDVAQVDSAVQSAARAFPGWSRTPPLERSRILLIAASSLEAAADDIATLISLETGRPYTTETLPEVTNAVRIFRYFAGLPLEVKGDAFSYTNDVLAITLREPLGVVGAIVPWNVPAMLFCLKVAPALAAGNTAVVKPAEQAPLSSTLLTRALADQLPTGILNVVHGAGETTGRALVNHPLVTKVSFTGSVAVGRDIYGSAAEKLIPVTLELGGKSPIIIFPDVDADRAAHQTIVGMRFSRQGQSCTATTRILVHADVREAFLAALSSAVGAMKVGDPLDDSTEIGTLVDPGQADRARSYVEQARREDVVVLELNTPPQATHLIHDSWVPSTVLLDPPMSSKVVQEEIFGPVATLHSWTDFDDVIEAANGTAYGLSACILTDSLADALTLARRLDAGFVQINSGMVIQPGLSFGGYKDSGIGREASLDSMLEAYTQVKTIIADHTRHP